jgi:hypothetical protein
MSATHELLCVTAGAPVGMTLGVIGGGGSILAVPLMVYVLGLRSLHVALGTSALAVTVSALLSLIGHARDRNIKWPCASVFALAGIVGASLGAQLGKAVDGEKLLVAFGALMIAVAALMLRPRRGGHDIAVRLNRHSVPRLLPPLAGTALGVGRRTGVRSGVRAQR